MRADGCTDALQVVPVTRGNWRRHLGFVEGGWLRSAPRMCALAFLLLVLLAWGCGKKGPPRPPEGVSLPPRVTDLRHAVIGDRMALRWTVPEPTEAGMSPAARFRVMVYQQRAADACSSCPPVYRKIGEVEVPGNIKDAGMRFEHTIDSGYRYTVTVIAVSADGTVGPMSNAVAFEH